MSAADFWSNRERAQGDEVRRMGKQPGEGAEEYEQDRGRHSNLPFDETCLGTEALGESARPREFEGAPLRSSRPRKRAIRQVS